MQELRTASGKGNPHLQQPIVGWGASTKDAPAVVVAVHGRARDPEDILSVCRRIGRTDLAYLAPMAAGGQWYPKGFMADPAENAPWVDYTMERLDGMVRELMAEGFGRERIVLMGFSQGACSVAEYALRHPHRYGAVLVFTGSAIGPDGTEWNYEGDFEGTPVLISGSREDDWVPVSRMRDTADWMCSKGAQVIEYYYGGKDHIVSDDEVQAARKILDSIGRSAS